MDIHNEVWESLGFYVYAYVDPTNLEIRYIGKGSGNRALSHLDSSEESEKFEWIQGLKTGGKEPRIDIIARNLTEENALLIERSLIDVIGLGHGKLTNKVRGHDVQSGRESIQEIARVSARELALTPIPANLTFEEAMYARPDDYFEGDPRRTAVESLRARFFDEEWLIIDFAILILISLSVFIVSFKIPSLFLNLLPKTTYLLESGIQ